MSSNSYSISPVGTVIARDGNFSIQLEPQYIPAILGLDGFSHLNIIWWSHYLDQPEPRAQLTAPQPYKNSPATLGIFATRSPMRPNPICVSVAQVISVDENEGTIQLAWIDAEDGTPVLDIKPYLPCCDRVRRVSTPSWNSHWPDCYEESGDFDWAAEFVNAM